MDQNHFLMAADATEDEYGHLFGMIKLRAPRGPERFPLQEGERSCDVGFDDLQHRLAVRVVAVQQP